MAALYLDECVADRVLPLLQALGHDVRHARVERRGASDDVQLLVARDGGRILVTANQDDFLLLNNAWHHWPAAWKVPPPLPHAGILLTRGDWRPERIARTVDAFFAAERPIQNRLYRWAEGREWVEIPPKPL